jgi:hypothetical protein
MFFDFVDLQNSSFSRKKVIGTMGAAILAIFSYRKIRFSLKNMKYFVRFCCFCDFGQHHCAHQSVFFQFLVNNPTRHLKASILSLKPHSSCNLGMDGAYPNLRLHAHWLLTSTVPLGYDLCLNHRNHLNEDLARKLAGKATTFKRFNDGVSFVRMGSMFLRMCLSVVAELEQSVYIHVGIPSPECREYMHAWTAYLRSNRLDFKKVLRSDRVTDRQRRRRENDTRDDDEDWSLFEASWTGPWWNYTGRIDIWVPAPIDRAQHLKLMAKSFRRTIFRNVPRRAEEGKWTMLPPTTDFVVSGMAVFGMLQRLANRAGAKFIARPRSAAEAPGAPAQTTVMDLSWGQSASLKLASFRELCKHPEQFFPLVETCMVLQPIRENTSFYLKCSKAEQRDGQCQRVLDFIHDEFSPVVKGRRDLTTLGLGTNPRLRLLFGFTGASSMQGFSKTHPAKASRFSTIARIMSASFYKRLEVFRKSKQMQAAALIDQRLSRDDRVAIGKSVLGPSPCCKGPFCEAFFKEGFGDGAGDAKAKMPTAEELLDPDWQTVLVGWVTARSHCISIARLERKNKNTNTVLTDPGMTWHHLSACVLNSELVANARRLQSVALDLPVAVADAAPRCHAVALPKPPRAKSALEFYNETSIREMQVVGVPMNRESWTSAWKAEQRKKFSDLPVEESNVFVQCSKADKLRAAAGRREWKLALAINRGVVLAALPAPEVPPPLVPLPPALPALEPGPLPLPAASCTGIVAVRSAVEVPVLGLKSLFLKQAHVDAVAPLLDSAFNFQDLQDHNEIVPLNPALHECFLRAHPNLDEIQAGYRCLTNFIASAPATKSFGAVRYQRPCGPICRKSHVDLRVLERWMLAQLVKIVQSTSVEPMLVGLTNTFVSIAYNGDNGETFDHIFSLDFATGHAHRVENDKRVYSRRGKQR